MGLIETKQLYINKYSKRVEKIQWFQEPKEMNLNNNNQ